mgnify:CR=1 FL=1
MRMKGLLVAAGMVAAAAAPNAMAQEGEVQKSEIRSYIQAGQQVAQIRQSYGTKMEEAGENKKQVQTLRQQAGEKMVSAVRDAGLTVDRYNFIASQTRNNPDMKKRVQQQMTQMSTGQMTQ